MPTRPHRASRTNVVLSQLMQPADANFMGNIHGGIIMKLVDEAAGVCAYQFCRTRVVTAAIDRIDFHYPVRIGNLVTLKANVNYSGTTSVEVGVRVEAEDLNTGTVTHTNSAYLVLVALGGDGKPIPVPELVPKTDEQKRWHREAEERRRLRLAAREPRPKY
jgi:acyl-CoA hydrolase